jgi:hypothetical protein
MKKSELRKLIKESWRELHHGESLDEEDMVKFIEEMDRHPKHAVRRVMDWVKSRKIDRPHFTYLILHLVNNRQKYQF